MEIRITYIGTLNGVEGMWCGFKPESVTIEEERQVLYPAEGYELEKDGERFSAVWLQDGDSPKNYTEVPYVEPEQFEPLFKSTMTEIV